MYLLVSLNPFMFLHKGFIYFQNSLKHSKPLHIVGSTLVFNLHKYVTQRLKKTRLTGEHL